MAKVPKIKPSNFNAVNTRCALGNIDASAAVKIFALCLWLIVKFLFETTIVNETSVLYRAILAAIFALLVAAEVLGWERYDTRDVVVLTIIIIIAVASFVSQARNLIWLAIFVYFLRTVDFKVLMLALAILLCAMIVVHLLMFSLGYVADTYVGVGSVRGERSSLGFDWPSRAGNYLLAMCMAYVCAMQEESRIGVLLAVAMVSIGIFLFTDARNPLVFTLFLAVAAGVCRLFGVRFKGRRLASFMAFLPWVLAAVVICLSATYDPSMPWMARLNGLTSNRLLFSNNALQSAPPSLFGSPLFGDVEKDPYGTGYLDSGYLRLLMTYGIVPFVILMGCLSALGYHAAMRRKTFLIICVACVLFRSLLDGGFVYLQYTPILLLLLNDEEGAFPARNTSIGCCIGMGRSQRIGELRWNMRRSEPLIYGALGSECRPHRKIKSCQLVLDDSRATY